MCFRPAVVQAAVLPVAGGAAGRRPVGLEKNWRLRFYRPRP